jgi:hypothetical protein
MRNWFLKPDRGARCRQQVKCRPRGTDYAPRMRDIEAIDPDLRGAWLAT